MKLPKLPKWAVITVIVVIILVVLFFAGRQFVGKAIQFTAPQGFTAGAETAIELPLEVGETLTLPIGASLPVGSESVAYEFVVTYDSSKLELIDVDSKLISDWGSEFLRVTPTQGSPNSIKVEHATIDFSKALLGPAAFRLAEVNFRVKQRITNLAGVVQIENVDVLSLESSPQDYFGAGVAFMQPTGVAACNANDELCGEFCTGNANDEYCGAFCGANQDTYCTARPGDGYTTDITGDGNINGQDAFVILKIAEAKVRSECGTGGGAPCPFSGTYTCDDGSFRINGYKGYTYAAGHNCPYPDTANYVRGGAPQ